MTTYLVVQKDGNIKQLSSKCLTDDILYKRAGFTTSNHFKCYTKWSVENINNKNYFIHVYGKTDGRANQENKYDFPPPIDNTLFFGNCLIINKKGDTPVDITVSEWKLIYEHLFGGFENIEDESESEDESEYDDVPRTKSGYVKDDFIVDDDESTGESVVDSDEDEYDDESEEEIIVKKKKSVRIAKTIKTPPKKKIKKLDKKVVKDIPENVFISFDKGIDCTNELCEEEYLDE